MKKPKLLVIVVLLSIIQFTFQADLCTKCENGDCTGETEECSTGCLDTNKRNLWSENNKYCNCIDKYYHTYIIKKSEYSCEQCPEECQTCYDTNEEKSTCKTCSGDFKELPECKCAEDSNAEMDQNNNCQCKKNYFQNKIDDSDEYENFCTYCPDKCNDCEYDRDFSVVLCKQCKDENKQLFIMNGGKKEDICTKCKEGLKKDDDDQCTICIADENKEEPECTECKEGLEKDDDDLCTICIADKNKKAPECTECKEGLKKDDDDDLCTICIADKNKKAPECTECKEGLKKDDDDDLCTICIADDNKKEPECTECKEGLEKDDDDLCTICIADKNKKAPECTECKEGLKKDDDDDLCTICIADDNKKEPECTECKEGLEKDDDDLCTICIADKNKKAPECTQCKEGFIKDGDDDLCNKCSDENKKEPECTECKEGLKKDDDDDLCTICIADKNKKAPECTECKEGLKKDDDDDLCTICIADKNKKAPECTECKEGLKKDDDDDLCTICIADDNKKEPECTECKEGLEKDDDDLCTICIADKNKKAPECTECKEGLKKDDDDDLCTICIADDNKKEPECTECKEGLEKDDDDLCTICIADKNKKAPECTECKEGLKKDDDDLCTICIADKNKKAPECTECKEGLKKDDDDLCIICIADKNKKAPDCTLCKDIFKNNEDGVCNLCNDQNKNVPECTKCKDGFFSQNDIETEACDKCQLPCDTCNKSQCLSCMGSNRQGEKCECKLYYYSIGEDKDCQPCKYPCLKCTSENVCTSCDLPSNRANNENCQCEDNYYEGGQGQGCLKCANQCGTCVERSDNCLTCAKYNQYVPFCNGCVKGTQKSQNGNDCILDKVTVYDIFGTENQKTSRCMSSNTIDGIENCQICRADKDQYGKIISQQAENNKEGTFAIRKTLDVFFCEDVSNESEQTNDYDQEKRVPYCEVYDHYGLCRRCLVRYGLKWVYVEGQEDGYYTCVQNEYNVPFCHEYDQNNNCIQCKWNQNDDEQQLYSNNKQEYQLDYALFIFNNKQYCINNTEKDMIMRQLDTSIKENYMKSNCAKYDSDYKCIACHTRKYDFEGNVQWEQYYSRSGSFYESQDYILSDIKGGDCIAYPQQYITHPNLLIKVQIIKGVIDKTKAECKEGYNLYEDSDNLGNYGCGQSIEKCTQAEFNWDYEAFQKTGLWHKKFLKCYKCEDTNNQNKEYLTNGTQCIVADTNYTGCQIIDDDKQCSKCKPGYIIVETKFVECVKQDEISIDNCKVKDKYTRDKQNNNIVPNCLECKFGYVPTNSGQCSFVENLDKRGCPRKDEDKVGDCKSYSKFGWQDSGKCEHGMVRNVEQLCYTSTGLKNIKNCEIYINTENVSKCFKCADNYTRSPSMDACLNEPTNLQEEGGIEFCVQMDGPWCQRCLRDVKVDEDTTIHYILTNQNTCVKNTLEGANQNCLYATYGENNKFNRQLGKCLQCSQCYKLDEDNDNCEKDEECLQQTSEQIYLYTDIQKLVNGIQVENCYIHRDKSGNCYECNRINGKDYGIFTDSNQKKICQECKPGQILEKNINGEYVCVTQVKDCIQYHENDYCISCGSKFLSIREDGKTLECLDQCTQEKIVYDAYSRQKICLKRSVDNNCQSFDSTVQREYYEYFEQSDGSIGERCGSCKDDYFINADNNYQCEDQNNFRNYDEQYSKSRVFSGITGDNPQVVVNSSDKFMNGPCDKQSINKNNDFVYIEQLKYCSDPQKQTKAILNCKIQDTLQGDEYKCKQCYPGFILGNNQQQCTPVYSKPFLQYDYNIENCQYAQPNSTKCDICKYGYILEKTLGNCKINPFLGCLQLSGNSSDNCSLCQYPFISVYYGNNANKKCDLQIDGCLKQTKENLCDECLPGYQYDTISKKCLKRTQNCYNQDFSISYDYKETQTMRGDVCKGCFQSQDKIRLFYVADKEGTQKLVKSCIYGCQQLKRKMNIRSPSHLFNTWECSSCRNNEYHISNNFGTKWCVKADRISNCLLFQQKVNDFKEVCILCKDNYYLNKSGAECALCDQGLVSNCLVQDTQATSVVNNKCKCSKCETDYYVTDTGECKYFTGDIENCISYDKSGNCTQCKDQNKGIRFLNSEGKCQDYSKDLNCGGNNGSNHSTKEDKCLKCDTSTNNRLLNNSGKCINGTIKNCLVYQDSSTCKQCDTQFGLNYARTECLNNQSEKMQNNCYRYNEQVLNGYLTCYECIRGYAIDYNFNDNQNEQCVQIDYCLKGYKKGQNIYCKQCKLFDYENGDDQMTLKRVFRSKQPSDIEGFCYIQKDTSWQIDNCLYYSTYTDKKDSINHCWKCHEGFTSDINEDKGTQCISNEHPGALPGCQIYKIFEDGDKYQKYEDLICRICYSLWRYSQDSDIVKFSTNTYSNSCDQTESINITLAPPNVWTGKDGGLRSISTGDDDDQGTDEFNPDDREQYEDPEVDFSNILDIIILNLILVLVIATV